jgi:uncharacterized membrane protein
MNRLHRILGIAALTSTIGSVPVAACTVCSSDHHILQAHEVVERLGVSIYDYLFLGSGALFIIIGWARVRSGRHKVYGLVPHGAEPQRI